jgi:hypothetical protein
MSGKIEKVSLLMAPAASGVRPLPCHPETLERLDDSRLPAPFYADCLDEFIPYGQQADA